MRHADRAAADVAAVTLGQAKEVVELVVTLAAAAAIAPSPGSSWPSSCRAAAARARGDQRGVGPAERRRLPRHPRRPAAGGRGEPGQHRRRAERAGRDQPAAVARVVRPADADDYNASAVYLAVPTAPWSRRPTRPPTVSGSTSATATVQRAAGRGAVTSTTAAAGRSPPRCRSSTTTATLIGIAMVTETLPVARRPGRAGVLPDLVSFLGVGLLLGVAGVVAAGPADQAPHPRARARRDRRPGRPARGAAALDPRGRGRGRPRTGR